SDGSVLKLIKGWLRAPIVEEDPKTGIKRKVKNRCGTPQGGVVTPRTHLVNSSFRSACLWCDEIGIWVLDATP
ncbi:MAG: hypothetical protein WAM53_10725, partial [Terrimicrobiaceae bacterium]